MEEKRLAEADRHIADAERRITEQEQRVAGLEGAGRNTAEARRLLVNLRETLNELHVRRRMILDEIARK
jgi:hypothetical protein